MREKISTCCLVLIFENTMSQYFVFVRISHAAIEIERILVPQRLHKYHFIRARHVYCLRLLVYNPFY